ncbi:MAG: hypothetical protein JXL20_10215 [Deltaproteobacteria bacterium]|nr:hypothetical protein [Deltaproteobacteria bacterium]
MIPEERPRKNPRGRGRLHGGALAVCILMTVLLPALLPATGAAHPPKEVVLSYDRTKQTLEVRITHTSKDPSSHYIKRIEIKKNGKASGITEYRSQPGQATFAYVYPLEIGPADVLEVTVTCSIFGSKTEKLTLP